MTTKERPILFSGPMVKAILEGRKTQTRRVMNNRHFNVFWVDETAKGVAPYWRYEDSHGSGPFKPEDYQLYGFPRCPYGQAGDRLWVRETWAPHPTVRKAERDSKIFYRADCRPRTSDESHCDWRPSIHMPRWASRITLEIVSVRVERLQGISEDDAKAEGVLSLPDATLKPVDGSARLQFAALWDSINAGRGFGWNVNPWVWVIEFKAAQP